MATHSRWTRPALGVFGLVAIAAIAWLLLHKKPAKAAPPHMASVSVAKAVRQDIDVYVSALGAAQAWQSDTILAQVTGMLQKVDFTEGTMVKAGQVLAQIDPALYKAAVDQAIGTLHKDQAALQDAKLDLNRYQTLLAQNSIARQMVDTQAALVKQDEGVVEVDQAAVTTAKVNLDRTRILSPISGRTGVRLIDPGNIIGSTASATSNTTTSSVTGTTASGVTGIVVVNQIEPIAVTFSVPQRDYGRLVQASNGFKTPLTTEAYSQDSGSALGSGQLTIADNKVDATTGTVEMKARFPNTCDKLLPGQFVNVKLKLQTLRQVVVAPAAAVNQGPNGSYVYVVGPDQTAVMRPVKIALTQGTSAVIQSGVNPGDTVVTDGQVGVTAGMKVKVAPPSGQGNPAPAPAKPAA
jgi:multidrug efflux system membrane fusion protein